MGGAISFQQFGRTDVSEAPPPKESEPPAPMPDEATPEDTEAARKAALERLAGALSVAAAEQARLRDGLIGAVAQALGTAAEAMLPALAREAFAARVADLTAEIARRGDWPDLTLSLAPGDRPEVEAALAAHGAVAGLDLVDDQRLDPGEAELAWSAGGAHIDTEAIAAAALGEFRQRLDGLASSGD